MCEGEREREGESSGHSPFSLHPNRFFREAFGIAAEDYLVRKKKT